VIGASGSVWMTDTEVATMRATVETAFDTTATIQRFVSTGESDYGNETGGWTDLVDVPCQLIHRPGREVTRGRDTQIADWMARLPYGTDLTGNDRLLVDGVLYEVVGPPADEITHLRAQLVHITG